MGNAEAQAAAPRRATGEPASRIADLLDDRSLGAPRSEVTAATTLYDAGRRPDRLYFIHEGQVRVFRVAADGSARLLEILGPGDWFGFPALARGPGDGTRAVAESRVVLSAIPAADLLALLPHHPALAAGLLEELASKLHAAHADAATLVFDDAEKRLVNTLLQFGGSSAASPMASEEGGEDGVVLRITHQQLAQHVGVARETVSLTLTHLRQRNLVRTGRNQLWFNPQALASYGRARAAAAGASPAGGAAGGAAGDPEPAR